MKILNYYLSIVLLLSLIACTNKQKTKSDDVKSTSQSITQETQNLLANLRQIPSKGFMFGHQDDPLYGVTWEGDSNRSDIKSIVGDFPAVMGFEIGRIEKGGNESLDNINFNTMRKEIINQYKRGGMITISWHMDNPLTGGDSWDVERKGVVTSILPNGENHEKFMMWLQYGADFFNSLVTDNGTKIPVLLRPWHEHTGSWFWWGKENCTPQEYKELWLLTYNYFKDQGVDNLLYAYSPDSQGPGEIYMERYPGDEYVDLLGLDIYHRDNEKGTEAYQSSINKILSFLTVEGKKRNKPIALTETGLEAIPIANWWTEVLYPAIEEFPISYVLVWRNARELPNHYYAPFPGQKSADDFVKFYDKPKTLFIEDLPNLYN
ncbi:MAG: glycoside hydrolase family 26 protein [Candidatus Saccharimonadaceae bacterium]